MQTDEIRQWFEDRYSVLSSRFLRMASRSRSFPGYAAMPRSKLKAVIERELSGLASFMTGDQALLDRATERHRQQATDHTKDIALDEQMRFLEARYEAVINLLEAGEPEPAFDREFRRRLGDCMRFYRVMVRTIETQRFLEVLDDPGSEKT